MAKTGASTTASSDWDRGFSGGFSLFRKTFGWIFMILGYLVAIFLIVMILSFFFKETILLSYVYNEVTDPLINSGFGNFIKKGLLYLAVPFSEEKQAELLAEDSYSWKSTIDKSSTNRDLGVDITKFEASIDKVNAETFSNVEALAEGHAYSAEPLEILFSCLTEKDKEGEVVNQNNILYINPYINEFFTVRCKYDENLFEIEDKSASFEKIKIRATYDFTTEAYLPIYILRKDILDEKREGGSITKRGGYNIFEEEGINDPQLNERDGLTSSVYTQGPINLVLRSLYTQPYTEEGPFGPGSVYTLDIKLNDAIKWTGNVNEIKDVEILIPEEIEIESENFESIRTEEDFEVYRAKEILVEGLNEACKPKDNVERIKNIIDEDCWRRGEMVTSLEFSITDAPEEISKTFIRARVIYKFNDEKQDTITFLKINV
tara:strand:- start:1235 stop:2533 length:1299 start_codon:yes stop_codon:yes gene_type:complete